jgi:hypothetical protein
VIRSLAAPEGLPADAAALAVLGVLEAG